MKVKTVGHAQECGRDLHFERVLIYTHPRFLVLIAFYEEILKISLHMPWLHNVYTMSLDSLSPTNVDLVACTTNGKVASMRVSDL